LLTPPWKKGERGKTYNVAAKSYQKPLAKGVRGRLSAMAVKSQKKKKKALLFCKRKRGRTSTRQTKCKGETIP